MSKHREGLSAPGICCLVPWAALFLGSPAPARDCNGNGTEDTLDLQRASSRDCNSNDVPDECDVGPRNLLFSEPVEMTLEGHTDVSWVALLEDFTADGLPDLVSFEPGNLLFIQGSGGGTFLLPTSVPVSSHHVISAVAADMNGDALQDVVAVVKPISRGRSGLMVLEGKGGGTFEKPVVGVPGDDEPNHLAAADLDGDGAVDIVMSNAGRSAVSVWWNDGTGGFPQAASLGIAGITSSVAAGDLDGDGDLDILASQLGSGLVSLFWNEGQRQFSRLQNHAAGGLVDSVVLVDLDRDGDLDLVSSSGGHPMVSVVLNQGGRVYSDPITYQIDGMARRLLAADADGDGSMDVVALRLAFGCGIPRPSLSVLLNRGDGTFIEHKNWGILHEPHAFALGDVDADGLLDAVVTHVAEGPRVVVSTVLGKRGPAESDVDADGVPDSCVLDGRDCNWNGVPDDHEIALGTSRDCDGDGVPDGCQPDCDRNGIPDACDIAGGAADADSNGLLDACESEESVDCNGNQRLDSIDIASKHSMDCNANLVPDECDVAPAFQFLSGMAVKLSLGGPAGGVAAADLDGDEDLDLAVAMRGSCCTTAVRPGSIALFENLGRGRLAPAGSHLADGDPVCVVAIDSDGDADADLLVANAELSCKGHAWAALLVNDGRGNLSRGKGFNLLSNPAAVATGDLDRDGDLDLAFANTDRFAAAVSIFLNDGTGMFTLAGSVGPPGGAATSIAVGDWNKDGRLDLAVAAGSLHLLMNAGGATFTPLESPEGSERVGSVIGTDLDRDGDLDLIADDVESGPQIELLENDGGAFSLLESHYIGTQPRWILAGDWNGDGAPDMVAGGAALSLVTAEILGGVSVLLNRGDGTLREAAFFTVDSAPPAGDAGDVNGDGTLDLIVADEIFGATAVFLNEGGGRLAASLQYTVGPGPRTLVALDANGDGDQDLAVVNELGVPVVTLLTNKGKGVDFAATAFREGVPFMPRGMVASDLDGDGDPDLAIAGDFKVALLRNEVGTFARSPALPVGSDPFAVVAFDLDRDGDNDLATGNSILSEFRDNVTVFRNEGSGNFASGRNFAVGQLPASLVASDLNRDGFDDLIACNARSSSLTVLRNLRGEGFALAAEIPTPPAASKVWSGDVDADGDPDLLVSDRDQVLFLRNQDAEGLLKARQVTATPHLVFESADLNGDARLDLVLSTPGQIHVLGNRGDGSFAGPAVFQIGSALDIPVLPAGQGGSGDSGPPGASSMAAADLDGDGDVDLAFSFFVEGKVLILSNVTRRAQPDENQNSIPDGCETPSSAVFRRGDAKEDGTVNITDAVIVLRHLFVTGDPLPCRKAADANDDTRVDVSDAVAILRFLFLGHDAPPEPFPGCGEDPTPDLVECAAYGACL